MKISNLKIVFAGTPEIGATILEELIRAGFKIELVITKADKPKGRGKKAQPTDVKLTAKRYKIPIMTPTNLESTEFILELKKINPDLILVAAYGKIFPKIILEIPKYGVLNVHPSLLPEFRGPSPIQFAILEGLETTGVTIITMSQNLDEGDILAKIEVPISKNDTTLTLKEKLAKIGAKLLIDTIPEWVEGKITPQPQNHLKATYTGMLTKYDGKIDPEYPPEPEKFDRMLRAFYPWPGVWTEIQVKRDKEKKSMRIKFLPNISSLIPSTSQPLSPFLIQIEGRKPATVKEFLNGYPEAAGSIEKLYY